MAVRPLAIVTAPLSAATAGPRAAAGLVEALGVLPAMAADVRRMADAVASLPHVDQEITRVAEAMPALDAIHERLLGIEQSMALLTEIHATLGPLPPALEKLDVALDQLVADLVPLQAAAERLNHLRLPGSRRRRGTDLRSDEQEKWPPTPGPE